MHKDKPSPRVQVITPTQTKVGTFPYTKGYARVEMVCPVKNSPNNQVGWMEGQQLQLYP